MMLCVVFSKGNTALHDSVAMGSSARDVIEALLGFVQALSSITSVYVLPAVAATYWRERDTVLLLSCRCGAKTSVKNDKAQTAYDLALELGHESLAKLLSANLGQSALSKLTKPKSSHNDIF